MALEKNARSETSKSMTKLGQSGIEKIVFGTNSIEGTIRAVLFILLFVLIFGSIFYVTR